MSDSDAKEMMQCFDGYAMGVVEDDRQRRPVVVMEAPMSIDNNSSVTNSSDINITPIVEESVSIVSLLADREDRRRADELRESEGPQKKKRGGINDLAMRHGIAVLKDEEKLNLLLETHSSWLLCNGDRESLTGAARNFLQTTLLPFINCLKEHYNGDEQQFLLKLGPGFKHTKFNVKRCGGVKDKECSL